MPHPSQKVCVFLASREPGNAVCRDAVVAVGEWIGRTGRTLVYGGARKGSMELLARTVRENGGRIYGVVPQILVDRGLVSDLPDVTFHSASLADRKEIMSRESDVFVALPGGIGTLDEVFTILGEACIGIRRRTVILYNADGCWSPLVEALESLRRRGLIADDVMQCLSVVDGIPALEAACSGASAGA